MLSSLARPLQRLTIAGVLILSVNAYAEDAAMAPMPAAAQPAPASESLGSHVDDAALTTRVKSRLLATDRLRSTHIHVKSRNGVVWLHGSVPNAAERLLAVQTVRGVDGVVLVHSHLWVNAHPDRTWWHRQQAKAHQAVSSPDSSAPSADDTYGKH